jgi:prepilin-type N-terminal cleavage/methylation domain-containing protein
MKIRDSRRSGFTLVELVVVMAGIGLLAAIVIPRYARARTNSQINTCIDNLRQIDGALHQYALVENVAPKTTLGYADIAGYLDCSLVCPAGGSNSTFATSYKISDCQTKPVCLVVPATHLIPN